MERTFSWDGEKIREEQKLVEHKHSPKDILDAIDNIRSTIDRSNQTKDQLKKQMEQNNNNLQSQLKFEKQLREFEDECLRIQKDKLEQYIMKFGPGLVTQAKNETEATIAKDPNAYTPEQVKQMPYLNYQRLLSINEKIGENISSRVIKQCLYEEPIFDNPFADVDTDEC